MVPKADQAQGNQEIDFPSFSAILRATLNRSFFVLVKFNKGD